VVEWDVEVISRPFYILKWAVRPSEPAEIPAEWKVFFRSAVNLKMPGKIYVIAVILDVVYQLIALHTVYPGEALLVGCLLAVVPYLFIRAPVTRIASHRREQP
jgi:hypothetical protein